MNRSGKTTRRIDKIVQLLFNNIGKKVLIIDYGCNRNNYEATADNMIRKISLRIRHEHDITNSNKKGYEFKLEKKLVYVSNDLIGIDEPLIKEDFNRIFENGILFRTLRLVKLHEKIR